MTSDIKWAIEDAQNILNGCKDSMIVSRKTLQSLVSAARLLDIPESDMAKSLVFAQKEAINWKELHRQKAAKLKFITSLLGAARICRLYERQYDASLLPHVGVGEDHEIISKLINIVLEDV